MTSQAESAPIGATAPGSVAGSRWAAVEQGITWAGDRLNAILIKETRQALKSRQFTITFALLLICGWVWSIFMVAYLGPGIHLNAQGPDLFIGYYAILAFALFVIVPFGAFRSLAVEQEDRTYELMSITTLGPQLIVRGKLGSTVLQMLVYLSGISPCLAFTYMLRGIDFPTILFIIFYTVLASLALSLIALLLGTLTAEKHWQVILSVVVVAGLLFAFIWGIAVTAELLQGYGNIPFDDPDFWQVLTAMVTIYASYFLLVFYAAAAQLTFESDNRSTRLRVVMVAQQVLFVGWMTWMWIANENFDEWVLAAFMTCLGLHWYAMGAFMSGESPQLSLRVKRQLPQSFLGRALFTWFNPGPATGYMLAIASLLAGLVMVIVGAAVASGYGFWSSGPAWVSGDAGQLIGFGVLGLSYVVIYLGVGLLVIRLLRKFTRVGVLLAILVQILLLLTGIFVPLVIQGISPSLRNAGYTMLHVLNPAYTLIHVGDGSSLPAEGPVLLVIVPAAALIVFVANFPGVAREVRHVRIARPERVAEEDAHLAALKVPAREPSRTSPWD